MGRTGQAVVGRADEIATLDRLLDGMGGGTAGVVFLTGEPGIGKTHVLGELVRRAEQRGCLVLEGSAAEFEQELPFGVVIDALDAYLESLDAASVDRLSADGLEDLASVFPALRSLRSTVGSPPTATERFRNYYAVRELLERLATRQPMVLVLDDLHWADGASTELVAHLLRRPPDAPVLLAGSYRSGQAPAALRTAIDAASRAGDVECIELGPLAPDEAEELLGPAEPDRIERLYLQSGGNPFYLLQLARVPGDGRARAREEGAHVPPAVVSAIVQELATLSPAARAFAEAAAVVGDPFELDLATLTAGVPEPMALACLDELIGRDLVRQAQVPRRFQFRHPLVRNAVYEAAPAGTRLALHARCAAALAAAGAPATTRAHHVEQSAGRNDRGAVAVLVEAGEATAQRAPSSAARWFQAALRLLPDTAPTAERGELVLATASVLTTAGRLAEARSVLLEGFDAVPGHESELRVRLTAACASLEHQLGLLDEAHGRLLLALQELTSRDSEAGVSLMVALATDGFYQMRYDAMKEWGQAAVTAAAALGNRMLSASAEAVLTMACTFTLDRKGAEEHCAIASAMVAAMTDEELAVHLDAIGHLCGAELYMERFEDSRAHGQRGVDVARAAGRNDVFPTLYPCLGTSNWVLGRLAESLEVFEGAVEAARLAGNRQAIAWSLVNLAFASVMSGDVDAAMRASQEAADLVGVSGETFVSSLVAVVHGLVLYDHGDPSQAANLMVTGTGGPAMPKIPGGWRATYLETLVRCYLDLGRVDDARQAAATAMAVSEEAGLPRTAAMAHRAAARLALHLGEAAAAVHHARISVTAAESNAAAVDAAVSRVLLGQALAASGDVARAAVELEHAAAVFDACGSIRSRDRAEQELRKLGHHISRRTQPGKADGEGLAALSGRELEVARLVVARRTNPEIAADLFLSLKTVESHMRNIFRKLDVSSRVEVARLTEAATPV
jgi:ATP/maltotriose-dependent transcriptional regulator MalT